MRLSQPFVRLPLTVDAARLAGRSTRSRSRPGAAIPRPPRATPRWCSSGSAGDPDGDSAVGPMAPTPHLDALPVRPAPGRLGTTVGRTRLMRIATESELASHVDTNYYWWHHLRMHVPVADHARRRVPGRRRDGAHGRRRGVGVRHLAAAPGREPGGVTPRIHLVVDTVGSAPLWDLSSDPIANPTPRRRRSRRTRPDDRGSIPIEQWNWPVVMTPAEVDATVGGTARRPARGRPDAGRSSRPLLDPVPSRLARPHRALRPRPAGWPARRRCSKSTASTSARSWPGGTLANGVVLTARCSTSSCSSPRAHARSRRRRECAVRLPRPTRGTARRRCRRPAADRRPGVRRVPAASGSSLLFETLQRSPRLATIGGESHEVIEGIAALAPAAHDWGSNRLDAERRHRRRCRGPQGALRDAHAHREAEPCRGPTRLLEKTPKNALRIPFLAQRVPGRAVRVPLPRSARDGLEHARRVAVGAVRHLPRLPGWDGPPWSLLLTPGWRDLAGRSLGDVVSRGSGPTTVDVLLDDLDALDGRPMVRGVATTSSWPTRRPRSSASCAFLDIEWDDDLAEPLPHSRHTLDSPHPDKWRRNADELAPFVATVVAPAATRALEVFADAPRTEPVPIDDSADRRRCADGRASRPRSRRARRARRRRRHAPETSDAKEEPSEQELFGSQHSGSFRALLQGVGASLVVTTYQAGRVVMVRDDRRQPQLALPRAAHADGRGVQRARPRHRHALRDHGVPEPARAERAPRSARTVTTAASSSRHRHSTGDIRVHDLACGATRAVGRQHPVLVPGDARRRPLLRAPVATAVRHRARGRGPLSPQRSRRHRRRAEVRHRARHHRRRGRLARAKADGGAVLDVPSGEVVSAGCRCRTHPAGTTVGCGCSSRAAASSWSSIPTPVAARTSPRCRASPAGSRSWAATRSSASRASASTPSTGSRSRRTAPNRCSAACGSSTP